MTRRSGVGGGTALPGLLAARIAPRLLHDLASGIPNGSIMISGTNGKTTTARMLSQALKDAGLLPISNREGSNLERGLATALMDYANVWGELSAPPNSIGLFEVDEGAFPPALRSLQPKVITLLNLFRDQLDRYFEVDYVARLWERALRRHSPAASIVLNADDPQVAHVAAACQGNVIYFGLEATNYGQKTLEHSADVRRCPECREELSYSSTFYAHLGHYRCQSCGWTRPEPQIKATAVSLDGMLGSEVLLETPAGQAQIRTTMPGLYNVYNALAAIATAYAAGISVSPAAAAISNAQAAFGRLERFQVDGKTVCIVLVKNPSGMNQVLRLLAGEQGVAGVVLALNDLIADGRDVSWIWDAGIEQCRGAWSFVICAGRRAHDMGLRVKYAQMNMPAGSEGNAATAEVVIATDDVYQAVSGGLSRTPAGGTLYVLPTYTALLDLRRALSRAGILRPYWRQ